MSGLRRAARRALEPAGAAYRMVSVPFFAYAPAPLAYQAALLRADLQWRRNADARQTIVRNIAAVFGDRYTPAQRDRIARDAFRSVSCSAVDDRRLWGSGAALLRHVEVRGLEHVRESLAAGKGVVICSAHYGSYGALMAVLGALGFALTPIKREGLTGAPIAEGKVWASLAPYRDHVARHMRPEINPDKGQFATAVQAALVLRRNELLGIYADPPALATDQARAVECDFLGGKIRLLAGGMAVAERTGAAVHVAILRRSSDWRRQTLTMSPAISLEGGPVAALKRVSVQIERAVAADPAPWIYWARTDDLRDLGLVGELPGAGSVDVPEVGVAAGND